MCGTGTKPDNNNLVSMQSLQPKKKKNQEEKKHVAARATKVKPAEERAIGMDMSVQQINNAWD